MEKEIITIQENTSLLSITNTTAASNKKEEYSPKKPPACGGGDGGGNGDRLKRDEWSEGAVSSLLEAYEAKWVLRNRAKLKGHDWEDVAKYVSSRSNSSKSPKTLTQCKNKIESMKKRYRSESATGDVSSWPLFPRLDLLLRGTGGPPPPPPLAPLLPPAPPPPQPIIYHPHVTPPLMLIEPPSSPPPQQQQQPLPPPPRGNIVAENSHGSNGLDDRPAKQEDGVGTKLYEHLSDKNNNNNIIIETDSSTPALYNDKNRLKSKNFTTTTMTKEKRKRKRRTNEWEIAESIQWLAEVVLRSEEARMNTMRELEKMRMDAEVKRGEMDLKRIEIIANTQLEIARLLANVTKEVDSSLRIGRN